jgi:RHS repeat-associated protein
MGGLYEVSVEVPSGTVTNPRSYYSVEGQMLAMSDGSTTSYMLTDHLGSIVGVVGEDGALVSEQRYLPFGERRTLIGAPATDLSFTGQRELTGTGLLDYHARQYDPSLRSFIQADSIIPNPYGVLDYNRYLYVHANPVRFTDPSGNRITEGCGDLGLDSCGGSAAEKDQDFLNAYKFQKTTSDNACKLGNKIYCSYAENHPVETVISGVGAIIGAAAAEAFILGGGAASITSATLYMAGLMCIQNALCRALATDAGGGVAAEVASSPSVPDLTPQNLDHIFGNPTHNLGPLLDSYNGNRDVAFTAIYQDFSKVAGNYSLKELGKPGIPVNVGDLVVIVRGTIVDGVARIGTLFIP